LLVITLTNQFIGNCHTADWSPDESCFAVSCEHGECYLFSFKVLPNNDLDIQLSATYDVKLAPDVNGEYPWGRGAIENVKFIPHPDLKLMAFAAANIGQIVIVDYNTFQIVQTFDLEKGGDRWWNLGVDFSSDGKTLFVLFSLTDPWNQISHLNKLLALKLKGVSTLTELCFKHIRKNKEYWGEFDLHTLPETLYEKLSLNNN
jgi:WD40 repeat protein